MCTDFFSVCYRCVLIFIVVLPIFIDCYWFVVFLPRFLQIFTDFYRFLQMFTDFLPRYFQIFTGFYRFLQLFTKIFTDVYIFYILFTDFYWDVYRVLLPIFIDFLPMFTGGFARVTRARKLHDEAVFRLTWALFRPTWALFRLTWARDFERYAQKNYNSLGILKGMPKNVINP